MTQRYSIWGREHGSDRDVEIVQVNANPQAVLDGLMQKMLTIHHSIFMGKKKRKAKIRKYTWLRIVENIVENDDH
jgi:predicted ATP-grasp superfamily ATP-dependent carboligase